MKARDCDSKQHKFKVPETIPSITIKVDNRLPQLNQNESYIGIIIDRFTCDLVQRL